MARTDNKARKQKRQNLSNNCSDYFRMRVLDVVSAIPEGEVLTYKRVAELAGNPKAARAVGRILNSNTNSHIPCHRVTRSDGNIGGYNKGPAKKRCLLQKEQKRKREKYK